MNIGKNFVFDKREAFDVTDPAGVGGVLRPSSAMNCTSKSEEDKDITDKDDTKHKKKQQEKDKKKSKKKRKRDNEVDSDDNNDDDRERILGVCCVCDTKWDRYIGKDHFHF